MVNPNQNYPDDPARREADARTTDAAPPDTNPPEGTFPRWVAPHASHVSRDTRGNEYIPGFMTRIDRSTGALQAFVADVEESEFLVAPKVEPPRETTLLGIMPAEHAPHRDAGSDYPKWIVPHDSQIVRDATGHVSVPGYQFHTDRVTGGITVLVENEEAEKAALAARKDPAEAAAEVEAKRRKDFDAAKHSEAETAAEAARRKISDEQVKRAAEQAEQVKKQQAQQQAAQAQQAGVAGKPADQVSTTASPR